MGTRIYRYCFCMSTQDPQDQFRERYNAYINQRKSQAAPVIYKDNPKKPKTFSPNKFYVLGIIVGLLIVAPIASFLFLSNKLTTQDNKVASNNQQTTNTGPSEQQINEEMKKIWGPYYEEVKNNKNYRELAKQKIIVRQLAEKNGLTSTTASTNEDSYINNSDDLKTALTEDVVSYRKINYLTTFIAPDPNDLDEYNSTIEKAKSSLTKIRNLMIDENKSMRDAFAEIKSNRNNYSSFTLQEDILVTKENHMDEPFLSKVLSSHENEISPVIDSYGSIFMFQVTEARNTPYATLNDFINAQK